MFHPVGSRPSTVYWRRRFALLAGVIALLVLLVLTVKVVFSGGSGDAAAGGTPPSSADHHPHPQKTPDRTSSSSRQHNHPGKGSGKSTKSGGGKSDPSTGAPRSGADTPSEDASGSPNSKKCASADLDLAAATSQSQYSVGDQPTVSIKVTNSGSSACVVDLADKQIVLRVYNGESRVWGSHDCQVMPGTKDRTLTSGATVKVSIQWSGLTSRPNCAGTRQRVGAGTYTLYASLAGHEGHAAQFSIK